MDENVFNFDCINSLMKGIVSAIFIAYLILYGLRPAVMYPDNILDIVDNPWVMIILLIINYYFFIWDTTIGLLMLLMLIALLLDIILFTEGWFKLESSIFEIFDNSLDKSKDNENFVLENTETKNNYKDINNIILEQLKKYKDKNLSSNTINSFI